jgi:NADH-quinone oxidoreductase subunit N
VIPIRERQSEYGDDIRSVQGLGRERPALAWPLTISMLALAGLPGTAGFIGKLYLIEGAVQSDYTWLGIAIVIGTMISLAYYLRVIAAVWMIPSAEGVEGSTAAMREQPAMAGGSPEADQDEINLDPAIGGKVDSRSRRDGAIGARCWAIVALAIVGAAGTVVFGVIPAPLTDFATNAAQSLGGFLS